MRDGLKLLMLVALVAGCSGRTLVAIDDGNADMAGSAGTAGTAIAFDSAGACADSTAPSYTDPQQPPGQTGCYVYTNGAWEPIPCDCELWLSNTEPTPVTVSLSLTFLPGEVAPSLTDSPDLPDVEIAFPDPDARWYDVWAEQAGRGTLFAVARADGRTTVRLGASHLVLDLVTLAGCQERRPRANIVAPWGTAWQLDMQATLSDLDGNVVSTPSGSCNQPQSHPTTM